MAMLKHLRAEVERNVRQKEIADRRGRLAGKDVSGAPAYTALAEEAKVLTRLEGELTAKGDQTRVRVYELPLPKMHRAQKNSPVTWTVSDQEWAASLELPIPLTFTADNLERTGFDARRLAIWLYQEMVYLADGADLTPEDVKALLNQDRNKRRLSIAKAHALQAMTSQLDRPRQRERIPQEVRIEVWQRDGGRCVECDSQLDLEFDHIIPFALGGAHTARNLQLLCGDCNRRKGMSLG